VVLDEPISQYLLHLATEGGLSAKSMEEPSVVEKEFSFAAPFVDV
jgi:hypothetical protein